MRDYYLNYYLNCIKGRKNSVKKSRSQICPFTWNGASQSSYVIERQWVEYASKPHKYAFSYLCLTLLYVML